MQSNNKNAKWTKTCKVAHEIGSYRSGSDEISRILHTAVNNSYYRSPQNAFALREKALRKRKRAELTESTDALMPITHTKSFLLWIFTVACNILTVVCDSIIQSGQKSRWRLRTTVKIWSGRGVVRHHDDELIARCIKNITLGDGLTSILMWTGLAELFIVSIQ